ncbi:FTL_1709 family lipoprotein [Francisella frigiditurris]|uniref:Lipoprotein n=1 Tax=Francisella frigiditurris TaxID=1542390 RepID=A0A1J0KUP2_9GAMM|nr:hypothetical protein [Francisella frigiditurris]APC97528.1 hypothetical protein KX01_699 [Francisella frigiditurris]
MKLNSKKNILLGLLFLSGCTATNPNIESTVDIRDIGHDYDRSIKQSYKVYGFRQVPNDVKDIASGDPTPFDVDVYITDNKGCKFIYMKTPNDQSSISETGSFTAYLLDKSLMKIQCDGKYSNIDYKANIRAGEHKYKIVGNLSYLAEASVF